MVRCRGNEELYSLIRPRQRTSVAVDMRWRGVYERRDNVFEERLRILAEASHDLVVLYLPP